MHAQFYKEDLDENLVEFLTENPGSSRKEIDNALTDMGYSRYVIDKAITRCKKLNLIHNQGMTMSTRWFATK